MTCTIGTADRLEYTVLGDVVNTASRLQSAAPTNGILVGEARNFEEKVILAKIGKAKLKPSRARSASAS